MNIDLLLQYAKLKMHEKLSKEKLLQLQWERFKKILEYAYENCPYYSKSFNQAGIKPGDIQSRSDIHKLPLTSKKQFIQSDLSFFSNGFNKNNCFSSTSSGSTGEPFTSYFDKNAWNVLKYASKLRARQACGLKITDKIANVDYAYSEEIDIRNKKERHKLSSPFLKIKHLTLRDKKEDNISMFNSFRPDAIYSSGSYLSELIDFLKLKDMKMYLPRLLFTSAELMDPLTRKKIEGFFGIQPHDIYGSSELKEIAWQCQKKEGYHINDDLYLVEVINQNQYGVGDIVVTSFTNKAMPLIRYQIKDKGQLIKTSCSCGRTFSLMIPTYGRDDDYLILSDNSKLSSNYFWTSISRFSEIPGILQFQVIQKSRKNITVKIKNNRDWSEKNESIIKNQFNKDLGPGIQINIELTNTIEREKSGKFKIFKSYLNDGVYPG